MYIYMYIYTYIHIYYEILGLHIAVSRTGEFAWYWGLPWQHAAGEGAKSTWKFEAEQFIRSAYRGHECNGIMIWDYDGIMIWDYDGIVIWDYDMMGL